jgi:hypothetical protein
MQSPAFLGFTEGRENGPVISPILLGIQSTTACGLLYVAKPE